MLESGALVLSDGGVCCIDEFDKMSDATRSVLHEVMVGGNSHPIARPTADPPVPPQEQQTVSIAKAGIITTLNARTSILAAANPVNSKYNPKLPIPANIDLPPTLISRFDLLYLVLDKIDEVSDRRLAKHLVGLYLEDKPETGGQDILVRLSLRDAEPKHAHHPGEQPLDMLTAYITYARSKIHPVLTEAASNALVQSYVEMRKVGEDVRSAEKRITATTRQLESMIRLSEAHARMRFSEEVELQDVREAFRLIRDAIRESAVSGNEEKSLPTVADSVAPPYQTDPITGQVSVSVLCLNDTTVLTCGSPQIDLDLITTGAGQQQRRMRGDLKREVRHESSAFPNGYLLIPSSSPDPWPPGQGRPVRSSLAIRHQNPRGAVLGRDRRVRICRRRQGA